MNKKQKALVENVVANMSAIYTGTNQAILNLKTMPNDIFGYAIEVTSMSYTQEMENRTGIKYKKKFPKNCTYSISIDALALDNSEEMDVTYDGTEEPLAADQYIYKLSNTIVPTFIEYDAKDSNMHMAVILSNIRGAFESANLPENFIIFEAPNDMQVDSPEQHRTLYILNTDYTKSNSQHAPSLSFIYYNGYASVSITVMDDLITKETIEAGYNSHDNYEFLLDLNDQYDRDILSKLFTKEQIEEKAREYDDLNKVKTLYEQLAEYNLIRDDSEVRDYIKGAEPISDEPKEGISSTTALKLLGEFFLEDDFDNVDPTESNNANVYLVSDIMNKYPTRLKKFAKAKGWNKPNGEKQQSDEC